MALALRQGFGRQLSAEAAKVRDAGTQVVPSQSTVHDLDVIGTNLLLLGEGAVLAHRFERPLAAEMDDDQQRGARRQMECVASTGTIGGRRAWTVSMISVLSMLCR